MLITIGAIGGVVLGSAYAQRELVKRERVEEAQFLNVVTKTVLVVGAVVSAGYLIYHVYQVFLLPYL